VSTMGQSAVATQDAELVARIRRGDTVAETTLYEKYSNRIHYLALRQLRSPADAEDVRAETFLRVLEAIRSDRLRTPEALASFVWSTAKNVIRECARQHGREHIEIENLEEDEAHSYEPVFLDPPAIRAVQTVVGRLKPREQAFLRMYYYEELSNEEIAEQLGIKEERLRLIKSRALKRFRELYERLTRKVDTK